MALDRDDLQEVEEATEPATELPRIEGFERCEAMQPEEVEEFLGRFEPHEVDREAIERIRFVNRKKKGDGEGTRLGGRIFLDGKWVERHIHPDRGATIEVFSHEGIAEYLPHERLRHDEQTALTHEVGHSLWERATDEAKQDYVDKVWLAPRGPTEDKVSSYPEWAGEGLDEPARTSLQAQESFCEDFALAINQPQDLAELDIDLPEDRRRSTAIQRIRDSVPREEPS